MRRLGLILALIPPLAVLAIVVVCGVDIPFWDEWRTPGELFMALADGNLSLEILTATHNESRSFFPKLLVAGLAPIFHWHPKVHMYVSWAITLLAILLLPRLQSRQALTPVWLLCVWPLLSALIENLAQWQSHLNGFQLAAYVPPLCLVAALGLQRSHAGDGTVFAGCALLSLVANYCFSNGFIVWLLAFPWLRLRRTTLRWIVFYALAGAVTVSLYMYDNASARNRALTEWNSERTHTAACYFLSWLASPYVQRPDWYPWATFAGAVLVALLVIVLLRTLRDIRLQLVRDSDVHPWLMLAGFAIISAALAAQGRIRFGIEQALSSRYAAFAAWFSVGLLGLASLSSSRLLRRSVLLAALTGAGMAWTGSTGDISYWRHHMGENRLTARLVELIPDNPLFAYLNPHMDLTVATIRRLRPAGLMPIDSPEKDVERALAHPVKKWGGYYGVHAINTNLFVLGGWTRVPGTTHPADFVVLTVEDAGGKRRPFTASLVGILRPGVVDHFHEPGLLRSGFGSYIPAPLPDPSRISVYAVDEKKWRAYRLRRE